MTRLGRLQLSEESLALEGDPTQARIRTLRAQLRELRQKRLQIARQHPRWTEIENDLVLRNRDRWLVSARTDLIYEPVQGDVFDHYTVEVVTDAELAFYVTDLDDLVFLQRVTRPRTWSEHVRLRTEKEIRRAAPRERPAWMEPTA